MNQQQPVDVDVNELSKDLNTAVHKVKEIQTSVKSFIDAIVIRKNDENEKETQTIKLIIQKVRNIRMELDKLGTRYSKIRLNNIHPIPLGNIGYVSLDPNESQSGFYKQLIDCYSWLSNIDKDASRILDTLHNDEMTSLLVKKDPLPPQSLKDMIGSLKNEFPSLALNDRLVVPEGCLVIMVGKSFVIDVIFSGMVVSHVIAKSLLEIHTLQPWESSKHTVFKTLSEIFTSAILNKLHLDPKELLRMILTLVTSYVDIFHTKCVVCGKYLNSASATLPLLPPVMMDTDGVFYHVCCR